MDYACTELSWTTITQKVTRNNRIYQKILVTWRIPWLWNTIVERFNYIASNHRQSFKSTVWSIREFEFNIHGPKSIGTMELLWLQSVSVLLIVVLLGPGAGEQFYQHRDHRDQNKYHRVHKEENVVRSEHQAEVSPFMFY